MTTATARRTANVLVATAGIAAAYVILTTPSLRRVTFNALKLWLGATVPAYLLTEIREAWLESGRAASS